MTNPTNPTDKPSRETQLDIIAETFLDAVSNLGASTHIVLVHPEEPKILVAGRNLRQLHKDTPSISHLCLLISEEQLLTSEEQLIILAVTRNVAHRANGRKTND